MFRFKPRTLLVATALVRANAHSILKGPGSCGDPSPFSFAKLGLAGKFLYVGEQVVMLAQIVNS